MFKVKKIENLMLKELFLRCCQIPDPKSDSENSRTGMTYPLLIQKKHRICFSFPYNSFFTVRILK